MIQEETDDSPDIHLISEGRTVKPRRFLWFVAEGLTVVVAIVALIHPLATLGARIDWRFDLITHFYVAGFIITWAAIGWLGLRKHYRFALAYVILVVIQGSLVFRLLGSNPVPPASNSTSLRIFMANIHIGNISDQAIATLIRRERPDVVGLVEVRKGFAERLEQTGIHLEYPYRYVHPVGVQGLLLWFREKPILVEEPAIFAPKGNPVYRATINLAGHPVRLWLVHPPNPIGEGRDRANVDLKALGVAVGKAGGTQVVIGDLNRTEGSPFFTDFLRDSGLRDTRLGYGPQPSWPSWSSYRIPIDQAFVSDDLAVVDRRIAPSIGSDHLPVILDIAPAATLDGPASTSSTNRAAHQPRSAGGAEESPENLARSTARR